MIGDIKKTLLLPHIRVQNANALSSPVSIGFPSMTAWLGATHALQRKLNDDGLQDFKVNATAVLSHKADLKTHKGQDDFVHSIVGTGNPLDRTGKRSAFIEEARIDLNVSILIEYVGVSKNDEEMLLQRVSFYLNKMRLAGGDILDFKKPELIRVAEGDEKDIKYLRRKLMPGFALVERRELMVEAMKEGKDAIDALLYYLSVHSSCDQEEEEVKWSVKRAIPGWVVPISVGFQGISELGFAKNQRDDTTPHRFAESVVTLGEFKMPYKINSVEEILWRYEFDKENDLYLCTNRQK